MARWLICFFVSRSFHALDSDGFVYVWGNSFLLVTYDRVLIGSGRYHGRDGI